MAELVILSSMRLRKKLLLLFLGLALTLVATVFACEVISRKHYVRCQPLNGGEGMLSCSELRRKYGTDEKTLPQLLWEIKAKREAGTRVSKQEYRELSEELVVSVAREDIGGNNGLACGYWGYVAWDLPEPAEEFVRRHELAHVLGEGNEFRANKEAGLEYPFGFVETAAITVWHSLANSERSFVCRVTYLWVKFKEYCLPWSWEPPVVIL